MRGWGQFLAALWVALALPAMAQQTGINAPGAPAITDERGIYVPSFSGGVAYAPVGVSFNPETQLAIASTLNTNAGTDTTHGIVSFKLRGEFGSVANHDRTSNWSGYLDNLVSNNGNGVCNSETCPGWAAVPDNASWTTGGPTLRHNINDATGGTNHSFQSQLLSAFDNNTWHTWVFIYDMNFAQGSKRSAIYKDGVLVTAGGAEIGTIGSFNVATNSALGFLLNGGNKASGATSGAFDIADVYANFTTGSLAACPSGLIDASNNGCAALLAAFYTGGAVVDLGTNCTGPTGTTPDVCLIGDKTTFATNKGTANALSLVNPLAGSSTTPTLSNAPYSPAGPPTNRPYFVWEFSNKAPSLAAGTVSMSTSGNGNGIQLNDLLLLSVTLCDTSVSFNRAIATPSGWTPVPTSTNTNPYSSTPSPCNYADFYRVAQAGDVTAENADWSSPPTVTWTANANALRNANYLLVDYRGANASAPIQASDGQFNTTSTSLTAPSVTATSAPGTLVTMLHVRQNSTNETQPTGQDLRFRWLQAPGGTFSSTMVSDEVLSATGATGTRVGAISATGTSYGTSLVLVH